MRVTPISAADAAAQASNVWPRGIYDFEVVSALEKVSKAGNDMIEMEVRIFNAEGKGRTIRDWLVESENTSYKVRHFADSVGMLQIYEKGELKAADLEGKTGRCQLVTKKETGYPDKNKISDYLPANGKGPLVASVPAAELDDEIPF